MEQVIAVLGQAKTGIGFGNQVHTKISKNLLTNGFFSLYSKKSIDLLEIMRKEG
jgi:hypothetical protein